MIRMEHKEISEGLFQVAYYDEKGMILFEETLTQTELNSRAKLTSLSEEKFIKALVDQPAETHRVLE
jgi:hypothetical protein